ncbi:MAG TPA: iron-containing alcohol dehydrogenase [Myxococcales bacterium]|nr:iron-containing alcohol dehydrogenase [Myxococcales bacterium]
MVDHASEGGEDVMPTFQYSNPETIHWGPGILREKLDAELRRLGAHRVFVVTTKSAAREPALAPRVEALLGDRLAGRFAGIGQHAPAHSVMEAVLAAREARADALLSIGGGSPIDAAKTVAFSLASGLDVTLPDAPARSRGMKLERTLPHLAVPTTLSVAELAGSAGFTAEGTKEKVGVAAPQLRPAAVFYDAELAVKTPLDLWLSTGIRAVDHAVETLLAPGEHPLPDAAALDGLRRLRKGLPAVKANPTDLAARTECQLGAWHSYLLPGPAAKGLSHTLGKRLGSRHDIPHGVSSCLLLPHVMRYLAPRAPETMKRIAEALEAPTAADGVARLISQLGLPNHLAAYKLSDEDLREAARPVAGAEHPEKDLLGILRAAL